MINLEHFYFQGEPGIHRELSYKLRRCGFNVRYYLNGSDRFYFIRNGKIEAAPVDAPFTAALLGNLTPVSLKEYETIIDSYIQERIVNGDWWLELNRGDEIQILDEFPNGMFVPEDFKKFCGITLKIDNISTSIVGRDSAFTKGEYFNGDYTGYYFKETGFRAFFSCMFVPKNTSPIEKIALSSIVLPKIIL